VPLSSIRIDVSWDAAPDNVGTSGYRVERILWLVDIDDLVRWAQGDFRPGRSAGDTELELNLCKGVTYSIKDGRVTRRWTHAKQQV
jgi:hypothetical protein